MKKQYKGYRLHLALLSCLALLFGLAGASFAAHPPVTLKAADNTQVTEANGLAYSSKATCGGCHKYDNIEQHSYHAQIGANEQKGFNPYNPNSADKYKRGVATKGKSWVQSPGHVGKW